MKCPYCLQEMPGDGETVPVEWYFAHIESRQHRWWWKMKRKTGRFLCWLNFHKHPKSYAPAWWTCERPDCNRTFHQRW